MILGLIVLWVMVEGKRCMIVDCGGFGEVWGVLWSLVELVKLVVMGWKLVWLWVVSWFKGYYRGNYSLFGFRWGNGVGLP